VPNHVLVRSRDKTFSFSLSNDVFDVITPVCGSISNRNESWNFVVDIFYFDYYIDRSVQ
jgi:hypothetical protein